MKKGDQKIPFEHGRWSDLAKSRLTPDQIRDSQRWAEIEVSGATLGDLRRFVGKTQEEVAAASGLSQSEVSRIERGDREAMPSTLRRFAGALGFRVAMYLMDDKDHMVPLKEPALSTAVPDVDPVLAHSVETIMGHFTSIAPAALDEWVRQADLWKLAAAFAAWLDKHGPSLTDRAREYAEATVRGLRIAAEEHSSDVAAAEFERMRAAWALIEISDPPRRRR